jgi:hypothetical protein
MLPPSLRILLTIRRGKEVYGCAAHQCLALWDMDNEKGQDMEALCKIKNNRQME